MAASRGLTGLSLPLSRFAFPFATGLRKAFQNGYHGGDFRADITAGIIVGIVALPLSMALAIAVNVPPQHGLYTAIFGGAIAALTGGSRTQVTGPTAAFVVILAPIVSRYGLPGLLTAGMMAGVILLAFGAFRIGRLIRYIPHPVTTGFTAGIAIVIATIQLKDALGLNVGALPDEWIGKLEVMWNARHSINGVETLISALTFAMLVFLPRVIRKVPAPLIAITLASLAGYFLERFIPGITVTTLGDRFHTVVDGVAVPGIPRGLPHPALPWSGQTLSFNLVRELTPVALTIATLGAIESLLSAVVADGMARTRHDPNGELIGQGFANLIAPFFGGIAATGALARTATNIRSGARTPMAAVFHSLTVVATLLLLAPLVSYIPMAALAALLLRVAWTMSDARHVLHTLHVAPKSDAFVLLICLSLTVLQDMIVAVSVGIVLAALLFMRRMADMTEGRVVLEPGETGTTAETPEGVALYEIAGPLFFGAAEKAVGALHAIGNGVHAVVLDLGRVPVIDNTGLVALESALEGLRVRHAHLYIARISSQPRRVFSRAKFLERFPEVLFTDTVREAFEKASEALKGEEAK